MRGRPAAIAVVALGMLVACDQPERVAAPPAPILLAPSTDVTTSQSTTAAPSAAYESARPAFPSAPSSPASAYTPSSPQTGSPNSRYCVPQYTVVSDTYARDARAGNLIGRVTTGTHVNVRASDGVWAYGYVGSIDGGSGRWAWMLHEKMRRTGEFCTSLGSATP